MPSLPNTMTPERLALLDELMPELRVLLLGNGLSREWLSERTGIPVNLLTHWLHSIGAKRTTRGWRLLNLNRTGWGQRRVLS